MSLQRVGGEPRALTPGGRRWCLVCLVGERPSNAFQGCGVQVKHSQRECEQPSICTVSEDNLGMVRPLGLPLRRHLPTNASGSLHTNNCNLARASTSQLDQPHLDSQ